jgi:hypothetical protein
VEIQLVFWKLGLHDWLSRAAANFDGEVGIQSPAALVGSGNWQVNNSLLYLFGGSGVSTGRSAYRKDYFKCLNLLI